MTKYFFLFALLSFAVNSVAQDDDKIVINYKNQDVSFFLEEGELRARVHVEEKITSYTTLNANVVRAVFFDEFSEVKEIKRNKKKVKAKVSDYEINGIFHSDVKVCYFDYFFTNEGESVVFKYTKDYLDFKFINKLFLEDIYPVDKSNITITVPKWLDLDILEFNFDEFKVDKGKKINTDNTVYTFTSLDVLEDGQYYNEPSSSLASPHILMIPKSMKSKGKQVTLMQSTDDLYAWYASIVKDTGNDNSDLKPLVNKLMEGQSTDEEKVKSIFYWIQDNIRYLAFENGIMGFKPQSCQEVLNNKYGDCKGMANLTKEMLKLAGFDARLTWLGTSGCR